MLSEFATQEAYRVTVRALPAQRLAYIRVDNAYRNPDQMAAAYDHLLAWYDNQGGQLGADDALWHVPG